ncbi:MAG TPA: DUF1634 domain-containing protein [Bacteroidota bacterium]|nr:DUF1634 domain-containing protein [Bacteroidota bacterium]
MTKPGGTAPGDGDEALEVMLGRLLQAGVLVAAAVVAAGGLYLLLARGGAKSAYATFVGAEAPLRSVGGILSEAFALRAGGIVQTGLLILIATPVLRVAFSLFGFARQRDWLYVLLTLIVLTVLTAGLSGWQP